MIVLGLDPGGDGQFGWCVAHTGQGADLEFRGAGCADHAFGAVSAIVKCIGENADVLAAGIDSPLFWVAHGNRYADLSIREEMKRLGSKTAGGTVQHVNSLRGACIAQGILAAVMLRRKWPAIRITEAHPKALLWLLQIATPDRSVSDIRIKDVPGTCRIERELRDHERDAALGALAAHAMIRTQTRWRNLRAGEKPEVVIDLVPDVEYWMPLSASTVEHQFQP